MTDPVKTATCQMSGTLVTGVKMYGALPTTLNPSATGGTALVVSEYDTVVTLPGTLSNAASVPATLGKPSVSGGKWYFEATLEAGNASSGTRVGLGTSGTNLALPVGAADSSFALDSSGSVHNSGSTAGELAFGVGDTVGVAVDIESRKIWFSVNGVWVQGNPGASPATSPSFTYSTTSALYPMVSLKDAGASFRLNFGQTQFRSPVPAGYNPGWY